jgi:hypothetical protein
MSLYLGIMHCMDQDVKNLPLDQRYIHSYQTTATGGRVILTSEPYLLKRIHKALSIHVDTTFKRTAGDLKEWELVMWDPEVLRGTSFALNCISRI